MTAPAIRVENLSKEYTVGALQQPRSTLYDLLARSIKSPFKQPADPAGPAKGDTQFWALRDVTFDIQRGDTVGIIGRNGAGKSTLLKILSRITDPTSGKATIRGRVASLLEVGTGFHGELTGRENIFLNGAILGMKRREIQSRFDQIVDFAEVDKFIDTPIKRYSSGMTVRLAFAVAAHLEPDILIADEVLAVGDRQFQEKCLGRMESMSMQDGKTIVFVSHNLDAIQRLCRNALYLREGRLVHQGGARSVIAEYMASSHHSVDGAELGDSTERWGSGELRISSLEIFDDAKSVTNVLRSGEDYEFVLSFKSHGLQESVRDGVVSLAIADARGVTVLLVSSEFTDERFSLSQHGGRIGCLIKGLNLAPGDYALTLFIGRASNQAIDCLNDAVRISVVGGDYFGTGHPGLPDQCSTLTRCAWRLEQ
jgi:lipopolysaccharide transport system ATP-binding protein